MGRDLRVTELVRLTHGRRRDDVHSAGAARRVVGRLLADGWTVDEIAVESSLGLDDIVQVVTGRRYERRGGVSGWSVQLPDDVAAPGAGEAAT